MIVLLGELIVFFIHRGPVPPLPIAGLFPIHELNKVVSGLDNSSAPIFKTFAGIPSRFVKAFWITFQFLSLFPPKLFYHYSSLFGCRIPCSTSELPVFLCLIFLNTLPWPFVLLWLHSSCQMSCMVSPYHALSFFSPVPPRLICHSLTNTRHVLDLRYCRTIVEHVRGPMTEAAYNLRGQSSYNS